jgi:phosphate transport system substrate-binding protein
VSLVMRAVGLGAVATVALAGCGSDNNGSGGNNSTGGTGGTTAAGCASGSLTAEGSTFQQTIEQQWSAEFGNKCSGAQVTYTGDGSSTGIASFGQGKVDFAGSDVMMISTEQSAANTACGSTALTVPVTAGGVAIIYNLKNVSTLKLSAATIAGIFDGSIRTWNDQRIKAENAGVPLPSTAIHPYWRNDGSGTTKVLTSFLTALAPTEWKLGADKQIAFPVGSGAAGSSGVVAGVKQTDGGITYAEVSYAKQNSLATAQVKGAGSYEAISSQTVSDAIGSGFSISDSGNSLGGTLDFTKMTGYPISTVSYVLVCSKYKSASTGKLVKAYLDYALTTGQQQADSLGFAPLPSDLATKAKASVDSIS